MRPERRDQKAADHTDDQQTVRERAADCPAARGIPGSASTKNPPVHQREMEDSKTDREDCNRDVRRSSPKAQHQGDALSND